MICTSGDSRVIDGKLMLSLKGGGLVSANDLRPLMLKDYDRHPNGSPDFVTVTCPCVIWKNCYSYKTTLNCEGQKKATWRKDNEQTREKIRHVFVERDQ